MAQAFFFASTAQPTTLSASISNTTTSIPLAATTGFPTSFPFTIALDYGTSLEELNTVNSLSGLNANVIRAVDGTSAAAHSVGAPVRHVSAARDFNNLYIHIGSSSGVHGITGNVVGDSDVQTLSNKTLTGTAISGAWTATSPVFTANAASSVPLALKGFSGQTADLFDVQTSAGSNVLRVLPAGVSISNQATGTQALVVNAITGTTVDMVDFQSNGTTMLAIQSSGIIQATNSALTNEVLGSVVPSVGSFDAFRIRADGLLDFGPGNAARDTQISRDGVNSLHINGALNNSWTSTSAIGLIVNAPNSQGQPLANFQVNGTIMGQITQAGVFNSFNATGTNQAFQAFTLSAANPNVQILNNGTINWGPGGASTTDVGLSRSSAGALTVSGSPGTIAAQGNLTAAGTAYTPGISGGALTLGNGTVTGRYTLSGGSWHIQIQVVAGSTTTLASTGNLNFGLPTGISNQFSGTSAVGNSYFTKTSGGAFNQGAAVVSGNGTTISTFIVAQSNLTWGSFNTTNGGAVATGSLISVDITLIA